MRILLVSNHSASSVTARKRVVISKLLSAGHDLELGPTQRRGHATRLAASAARRGFDAVVALGGDGTLNEVANGLVGTNTALAVLPGGSTNVFARTIGMAEDPMQAALQVLDSLQAGSIARMGLGNANGRYFVFHAGFGWDSALVARVEAKPALKRALNHVWFIYSGFTAFFRDTDRSSPWFTVSNGEQTADGWQGIAVNSNPYTFVGARPFDIAPYTGFDRPLTMITATKFGAKDLLGLAANALISGERFIRIPSIEHWPDQMELTVSGHRSLPWQVDGDFMGETDQVKVSYHPDALSVVLPTGSAPPLVSPPGRS